MKNANVIAKVISSKYFDYSKGSFSAEDSSLPEGRTSRIYNDACDEGFIMKSEKTGDEVIFFLANTLRDREGDVTHWLYKPSAQDIQRNARLSNVTVTVWND